MNIKRIPIIKSISSLNSLTFSTTVSRTLPSSYNTLPLTSHHRKVTLTGTGTGADRKLSHSHHHFSTSATSTSTESQTQDVQDAFAAAFHGLEMQSHLTPREVVKYLDNYIIGQQEAKRAVAIAFRNRWRRQQLPLELRNEIIPKNIMMIGPTGCGKTEIARRLAKLSNAPFLKTEATKYTEVGYHGQDAVNMIKEIVDVSFTMTKKRIREQVKVAAALNVEMSILKKLIGENATAADIDSFRSLLRNGSLDDRMIEIELQKTQSIPEVETSGAAANDNNIIGFLKSVSKKIVEKKKLPIKEARAALEEDEVEKLVEQFDIQKEAIKAVEENGIIVIDEIDKIVSIGDHRGSDASAEGVQRDLLPIIEGTTVTTKRGNVNTDFILFICAGSFHSVKPSDMLPELQGRLPIRVNLKGLSEEELYRILTEPVNNLIKQQVELMKAEKVELTFTDCGIKEIAKIAADANRTVENIGARRLFSVVEKVMEEISFEAAEKGGTALEINAEYVKKRLHEYLVASDLRRYII